MKPSFSAEIENVSDTALWVAVHRAHESKRPDALFQDPLAEVLAGSRGKAIAHSMSKSKLMEWVMVVRTCAIDRLILNAIKNDGVDLVLNVGAGLDTRPYRLDLPSGVQWVEVDFPNIIALKNEKLKNEKPRCHLERVALDLADLESRKKFFAEMSQRAKRILVLTEGVIPYLSNDQAALLAADLLALEEFRYWVQDYRDGGLARSAPRGWRKRMKASPFLFHSDQWLDFFARQGWTPKEIITSADEARRIGRPFPFIFPWSLLGWTFRFMPKERREKLKQSSGYVLLEKSKPLVEVASPLSR